jgi:hypothetical protein
MKLIQILREIGEATAKPYPFDREFTGRDIDEYQFTTYSKDPETGKEVSKNKYAVVIEKDSDQGREGDRWREADFEVSFGLQVDPEKQDPLSAPIDTTTEVNDPKNMFRVMATVMAAVKKSIKQEESDGETKVTRITMVPTKRDSADMRRTELYKKYIQKELGYDPETKRYRSGVEVYTEAGGRGIVIILPIK